MTSPLPYPIHPIAEAATQIAQGEDPWFALGGFLHDWWCNAKDHRQDLIAEPPAPLTTAEGKRWAAVCAAVVEEVCLRSGFPCPVWITRQEYVLEQPWFYPPQPAQQDWLRATTPEPFQRRNVFLGENVLDNKYELRQIFGSKPKWEVWSEHEIEGLLAANESSETELVPE